MAKASKQPQNQAPNTNYVGYIPPELQVPLASSLPAGMTPQQLQQKQAELAVKLRETIEAVKSKAEDFKKEVLAKYKKETLGMVLLPPRPPQQQACPKCGSFEVQVSDLRATCKACNNNFSTLDLLVLLQTEGANLDEKFKKKDEIDKKLKEMAGKKLADVNISSAMLDEIWDMCFKGKYDVVNLIAMGVPIFDAGWIGALRLVEIHKNMVMRKFEKYVVSYVLAGSMVRGTANAESDIDTFIVIDDTDVTRMTATELVSKLRGIIWGMGEQAGLESGVRNKLNVQIYILTDMWNNIKNSNPVIFTFLRDGIPLYDRGMFAPWKLLLKQGKITPTPEAIDVYMKSGTDTLNRTKLTLKNIAIEDFFWATLTPTQGALMMMGVPPPAPKETTQYMKDFLVKPGYLEERWVQAWEDIFNLRKDLEHGKIKEVSAKVIDEYMDKSEKYLARLDKLMKQMEVTEVKKEVKQLYDKTMEDVSAALKIADLKVGDDAVKLFEKEIIAKKLAPSKYSEVIERVIAINKEGKADRKELASLAFEEDKLSHDTFELIRANKGKKVDKYKISASYGENKRADLWLLTDSAYVVFDTANPSTAIKKYSMDKEGTLVGEKPATLKEVNDTLEKFAGTPTTITRATIESLKKILGENVRLVIGA